MNKNAQFYVAISRMRFAELTALIAFKAACIKTNKDIARIIWRTSFLKKDEPQGVALQDQVCAVGP